MPTVGLGVGVTAALELAVLALGLALASALTLPWGLLKMLRMPPIQSGLMAAGAGAGAARVLVAKMVIARVKKRIVAVY